MTRNFFREQRSDNLDVTETAVRRDLRVTISAGGELESAKTIDVTSDVEGQTKIVERLEAGQLVRAGVVVVRLDAAEIERRRADQEIRVMQADAASKAAREELTIQKNKAASQVAQAELAVTLAALDLESYLKGEYQVQLNDLKGSIALAETELREAEDQRDYFHKLVKEGFRTPEQLRAKEQEVSRAKHYLERDREKLRVLQQYTLLRQRTELTANQEEAKRDLVRAKSSSAAVINKAQTDLDTSIATLDLERKQLAKLQSQVHACEVRAPQDGVVVYPIDKQNRIEVGEVVHFKQKLFSLPDLSQMQVRAFVDEAHAKKVKPGLDVEIRVEAFPNKVLHGKVISMANFHDALRYWIEGGVKEYPAVISIENLPNAGLKPGMTAKASIVLDYAANALVIPVQGVAESGGKYSCYVIANQQMEPRNITIGICDEDHVQVLDGIQEGESVSLDARVRSYESDKLNREIDRQFNALDSDGDGKINYQEAPDRYKPWFKFVDGNGDGFIDRNEIRGAAQRFKP